MLTDYETKYWILAAGLVLMGCGIMLFLEGDVCSCIKV